MTGLHLQNSTIINLQPELKTAKSSQLAFYLLTPSHLSPDSFPPCSPMIKNRRSSPPEKPPPAAPPCR
ncbi:hypothetical protein AXF42_Ash005243 [Apostasia shenzhenica]|uniref:Uncharacterized protein n=1 Tax=Apostasia shenzhenica TaxID=1088818 RepID=A0A2I0B6C2_9ASPA|nr:hypothetical protein AXF42_Ash005243 [Apostasia shenzhenica]